METSTPRAPRIVGIDGRSGSGKSSLARRLAGRLRRVRILELEDAYPGWDGLAEGLAHVAEHALAPLADGRAGRYRRWDWVGGEPGPWVDVPPLAPGEVLLVEGCGAISDGLRPLLDYAIWCEAPEDVRRARALARDPYDWGAQWEAWAAQEESLGYARAPDLVLDTSGHGEDVHQHDERVSADPIGRRDLEQHP